MKKIVVILLAVVLAVSFSSSVFAGGAPRGVFKKGIITEFNEQAGTILFSPNDAEEELTLTLDKSVKQDEITIGKRVIVSLDTKDQSL
ncbi:MAG: hypothetical protein AMK71_12435, partial [Nitrospira bacterium SG8_35_4]